MALDTGTIHKEGNISSSVRFMRAIVAIVMLAYPLVTNTANFDLLAVLPLVAIYPMFTAIVGWDPIQFALETAETRGKTKLLNAVARITLVVISTMMIAAVLTISDKYTGWYIL